MSAPITQLVQGGAGDMIWVPSGPYATTSGATPRRFGIMQEVSVDFAGSMKELYGKKQIAINIMNTELKITGKAKSAEFKADLLNFFFGVAAPVTGMTRRVALDEAATPSSGTYTVAQTTKFAEDLGVYDTVTGLWMPAVTATPPLGSYIPGAAGTGTYTFNGSDSNPKLITYAYTVAATGVNVPLLNIPMGSGPRFQVTITNAQIDGLQCTVTLNKCGSTKLGMAWKYNDFNIPEFDFFAMDDGSGAIGSINLDQTD